MGDRANTNSELEGRLLIKDEPLARTRYLSRTVIALALTMLAYLPAQIPTLQFSSSTVPAGDGPRSAILVDLNRDGNRDLAVANINGSTISLLFGDGLGAFMLQDSLITVHKAPHAIASGDFNEDGVVDAVTANRDAHTVALFLGDSEGGFLAPTFFETGLGPRWIAVADFDDDGHADLAVTNRDDDNVSILLGDGYGNFNGAGSVHSGDGPVPIAAADFNGDGYIDLAVGNDRSDSLVVLAGDGTGGFAFSWGVPVGQLPKNIAVGDLNQDGLSDIAVACVLDGTVTVLLMDGQGSFTVSSYPAGGGPFAVVIQDFDGDGRSDLAVADGVDHQVAVLLADGLGGFAQIQTFPTGLAPHALLSGDFNRDGRPDLAVPNTGDNTVTILINETPPQASVHEVAVIQKQYSEFFPDPIISRVGQPLRLHFTPDITEHQNQLGIFPFIMTTDLMRVGKILQVDFTPLVSGTFQIKNLGHGSTGDIIIVEDSLAVDQTIRANGQQGVSLIHSNAESKIYPPTIHALTDIPLTIYNISLDTDHWVSIEPWITAPVTTSPGNVKRRLGNRAQITMFEFTPNDTGRFVIQHTMHGFSGTLIVEGPFRIDAPTNLTATPGDGQITLTWSPNTETDFFRYYIYGGTSPGPTSKVDSTVGGISDTTKSISGLVNGITYYYRVTAVDTALMESEFSSAVSATPATLALEHALLLPTTHALYPSYPNPFNPVTTLRFDLPQAAAVRLVVYDLQGREVARLLDRAWPAGYHHVVWDGRTTGGQEMPSGIYIGRMVTPQYTKSIKMVLLR